MHSLYFLIPTFLIILLLMPIFLEVKVSYNVLENSGVFCAYIFKIKLQYFLFEINGKNIQLKSEGDERETKPLDFNSPEIAFVEELTSQIKDKTRLRFLEVYYNIGLGDAFQTSMVCGMIDVAALIFFTSLKNKKPTASLGIYDTVSYNKKVAELAVNINLSLSLFDLVYSFINSCILSKKKSRELAM